MWPKNGVMDSPARGTAAPAVPGKRAAAWRVLGALPERLARTLCLLVAGLVLAGMATAQPALRLDSTTVERDLWEAATVRIDPDARWTLADVRSSPQSFQAHQGQRGNLGRQTGAVWMRVRLQADSPVPMPWMLEIDYAPLDRIDVYVFEGDTLLRQAVLGDHVDVALREWPARAHVLPLVLPAGHELELMLRVQSTGSLLVPARLVTPAVHAADEAREQVLQGLLAGMALCLLVYTLSQWVALRDAMFGFYALTLLGTVAFFAALSGVGPQHVWGASTWLTRNGAPFFILLGVCGAFFFVLRALDVSRTSPRAARVTKACGLLAGLTALALVLGLVDYAQAQAVGMALGPTPLLLVLPTAWQRWRAGDRAALYVLVGWGVYCAGVAAIVGLLAGALPVNFWTLHGFQFGSILEMTMWMMVLAHRVNEIRSDATRIRHESEQMRSLAHTDMLTGLMNRRGLEAALPLRLARCTDEQVVAIYLLDLDGFKQVNDSRGHGCGDELLQAVAQRLRHEVRPEDLVCRLGGDEFVVCVAGLAPGEVTRVAHKLLRSFDEPFWVGSAPMDMATTIGCATAPQQGRDLSTLLKHADLALYQGKAAGKRQVRAAATTDSP
jgi:diguanylate cyclase (GGDEF)-like protein